MFVVPTWRPADPKSRQLITSSAVITGCSVAPTITERRKVELLSSLAHAAIIEGVCEENLTSDKLPDDLFPIYFVYANESQGELNINIKRPLGPYSMHPVSYYTM